jgi:excisionase family DNA binding protein|tara:strand:- start:135 stop:383 length:249 start_codon:yes stop_codon:yes gene_type:complete
MMNEEPFVQIEELSKHFAVSISTIRAWVRQGHIPKSTYIKIGNTYRFNKTSVTEELTKAIQDVHEESTETQLEFDFNADEDV